MIGRLSLVCRAYSAIYPPALFVHAYVRTYVRPCASRPCAALLGLLVGFMRICGRVFVCLPRRVSDLGLIERFDSSCRHFFFYFLMCGVSFSSAGFMLRDRFYVRGDACKGVALFLVSITRAAQARVYARASDFRPRCKMAAAAAVHSSLSLLVNGLGFVYPVKYWLPPSSECICICFIESECLVFLSTVRTGVWCFPPFSLFFSLFFSRAFFRSLFRVLSFLDVT